MNEEWYEVLENNSKLILLTVVYTIFVCIYLYFLNALNVSIAKYNGSMQLLGHDNYAPIKYCFLAIMFWLLGFVLLWISGKQISHKIKNATWYDRRQEMIQDLCIKGFLIVIVFLDCTFIWIYINNPILRLCFFAALGCVGVGFTLTNKQ